jgi:hypothetical protein
MLVAMDQSGLRNTHKTTPHLPRPIAELHIAPQRGAIAKNILPHPTRIKSVWQTPRLLLVHSVNGTSWSWRTPAACTSSCNAVNMTEPGGMGGDIRLPNPHRDDADSRPRHNRGQVSRIECHIIVNGKSGYPPYYGAPRCCGLPPNPGFLCAM